MVFIDFFVIFMTFQSYAFLEPWLLLLALPLFFLVALTIGILPISPLCQMPSFPAASISNVFYTLPHLTNCSRLSGFHNLLLIAFGGYWMWELVKLVMEIPELFEMFGFYTHCLVIPDSDMQSIRWNHVVNKLVELHAETAASGRTGLPSRLNAHDVVNRILRKENYLIALFNKDILDLSVPLPKWLLFGFGKSHS